MGNLAQPGIASLPTQVSFLGHLLQNCTSETSRVVCRINNSTSWNNFHDSQVSVESMFAKNQPNTILRPESNRKNVRRQATDKKHEERKLRPTLLME